MRRLLAIPLAGLACFFFAAAFECWMHVLHPHYHGDRLSSLGVAMLTLCAGLLALELTIETAIAPAPAKDKE
jgi:hypothetical protein